MPQDLMPQVTMTTAPEAGVMDLLRLLRSHVCCEYRSDFRRVLHVYQHLLSPREDAGVSVHHKLLELRAKLLSYGQDAGVADVVGRMDRVVERCMSIEEQQKQSAEASVPMDEVMRLLVALAGGEDGRTFVLEDSMQVTNEKSSLFPAVGRKRIGDRIRMNDIEMMQHSRTLFHKAPVSMQEQALFSQGLFSLVGNGISRRHTSLWCPDNSISAARELLDVMPFKQPNRFFDLPGSPPSQDDYGHDLTQSDAPKRQRHRQASTDGVKMFKTMIRGNQTKCLSPSKEVFFSDGTQEVHCGGQMQADWGDASSVTENLSWGSESSLDTTESWKARTYAWEELGDRMGLPESYAKPPVRKEKRSLRDVAIPNDFACNGETSLEIHEEDLIEDSLRALCGVDSTLFRRDSQSATFQLPRMRKLKLRNTTVSVTMSVLEVFRKAGTLVMRLEFLAIYYSQDPARGGKTLQAIGTALQLFLSTHRTLVETIKQECLESLGAVAQEDEGLSITKLLCKTRNMCRVMETIGHIFGCNKDVFWPLLHQGKFPRGIAFINRLHRHVSSLCVEDSAGRLQDLVIWFLVKSSSPLLAVLSDLISSGRVDESTDPFDEFEATAWSRNLLEKAAARGGDGLFCEELAIEATEMLPKFLGKIAPLIIHLSQVQALLRSVNAIAATHPLVNMQPLKLLTRGDEATERAEEWKAAVAEDVAFKGGIQYSDDAETHKKVSAELSTAEEEPSQTFMSLDTEGKQTSQLQQRNMLNQQVLEQTQLQLQLKQQEEAADAKRVNEEEEALTMQVAYGREVLLNKYSVLMNGAEERHDYMKWRRDRAVRLSNAKEQLECLRADDLATWTAVVPLGKEKPSNKSIIRACEEGAVNYLVEDNVDNAPEPDVGITTAIMASMPASTSEWRASVKVNVGAGNRAAAFSSDSGWRASVKVNKEAGSRTSISIDDNDWRRPSVKVNKEVECRTSATDDNGTRRALVKVNKEAGRRSSGIFNDASSILAPCKTGIRILHEPGGSGADMYGTLYGGADALAKDNVQGETEIATLASGATGDVEMEDTNSVVDESVPMDDTTLIATLSEGSEHENVEMHNGVHDEDEYANRRSDRSEELAPEESDTRDAAESRTSPRLSLPPVHSFFSVAISQEDSEVLTQALSEIVSEADFTSFESIANCCVEIPVRLVTEKLEQVAVDWFRTSLQVLEHLLWLRKLMLMSEGLCMDIFARDFLIGLNASTRVNWGLKGRLSSALTLAMIEGSVTLDDTAQAFHYKTSAALSQMLDSLTMTPAIPSVLNQIELVYDVKWPLGFVITTLSLDHYKQMHQFLLHVRLTSLEMRETWGMLRTIRRQGHLSPSLERLCGGVVYKIQAFLLAFSETFATKVLGTAWSKLEHATQKATKLIELRRCHEEYVSHAVRCCFLDKPAFATRSAFLNTLAAAWSLTGFIRAFEKQVTGRASEESRARALCEELNVALQVLVGSLQSITHDAERNTREFSECLLLRLNFNQFYSTDDVPSSSRTRISDTS